MPRRQELGLPAPASAAEVLPSSPRQVVLAFPAPALELLPFRLSVRVVALPSSPRQVQAGSDRVQQPQGVDQMVL